MSNRPWQIVAGCVFGVIVVIAAFLLIPPRGNDLTRLKNVYYTPAEEWLQFYAERAPDGFGWVHLPTPQKHEKVESKIDPEKKGFIRPEVCGECHKEIYERSLKSSHILTAREGNATSVNGSFEPGKNVLKTRDPNLNFEMLSRPDGLFQRLNIVQDNRTIQHEERIDLVTGSGNHGQTYLYWKKGGLYELPVSHFSESNSWVNSPGPYRDGTADFARSIGDRCLDCHCTFFAKAPDTFNEYDRNNYILGVTCVRCHGLGWAHVQYHRQYRDDHDPHFIVNPAKLTRDQSNDVCAQCHSGAGELLGEPFSYHPGTPLSQHLRIDVKDDDPENDDPHATNQLARIKRSKCYQKSERLTCATCHDPHSFERGDRQLFAKRCLSCHVVENCKLSSEHSDFISDRCILCHMPSRRDETGAIQTAEGKLLPLLRDHHVTVYPELSKQILSEKK